MLSGGFNRRDTHLPNLLKLLKIPAGEETPPNPPAEGEDEGERLKRGRRSANGQGGALPDWTRLPPFRYRADCGGS